MNPLFKKSGKGGGKDRKRASTWSTPDLPDTAATGVGDRAASDDTAKGPIGSEGEEARATQNKASKRVTQKVIQENLGAILSRVLGECLGYGGSSERLSKWRQDAHRVLNSLESLTPADYSHAPSQLFPSSKFDDVLEAQAAQGAQVNVHVRESAHRAFVCIRSLSSVSMESFAASIGGAPLKGTGGGAGRSGASFFFTADKAFIVKSLTEDEMKFLIQILPSYVDHITANQKTTLLTRFLGLFRVKLPSQVEKPATADGRVLCRTW